MPVTRYLNTDASAPVLTGNPGSIINLLDACLVNGYGAKPAAGWTKAFSGTNIAVYRNNPAASNSSGCYVRVDDTHVSFYKIKVYKTMTDINTGTDVTPDISIDPTYSDGNWRNRQYSTPIATGKSWQIIADDRTVYLNHTFAYGTSVYIAGDPTASHTLLTCFGDYDSFIPGNEWNYMVMGGRDNDAYGIPSYSTIAYTTAANSVGRNVLLQPNTPKQFYVINAGGTLGANTYPTPNPYTSRIFSVEAFMAYDSQAFIGKLRGVRLTPHTTVKVFDHSFGTLLSDPTGPVYYQMFHGGGSPPASGAQDIYSILVKSTGW